MYGAMVWMDKVGLGLEQFVDAFYYISLAQHHFVPQGHKLVFHVWFEPVNKMDALVEEVLKEHNLKPLSLHHIINSFLSLYDDVSTSKSPIKETISQSISPKRRRFSEKCWTFFQKRGRFSEKCRRFFLDSQTFLSTLSLTLVIKHQKGRVFS